METAALSSRGSKLVALALVAIVVAAGFGYWILTPEMPSQIVSATQQTSQTTSTEQTSASTAVSTTVSETAEWINVGESHPVSYYVSLLKSSGTQPYVELGWELQALPDATNATAVAKITYLALNATNPEVKEAFQLMIKGGTPDPTDFEYTVPNYNTELQLLYWLALDNEFKRDDTLALAIAMVNGLWVSIGDEQVRQAVRKDTSDLLAFFRETDSMQGTKGFHRLENYPLEAKVALAWTGGQSVDVAKQHAASLYLQKRYPMVAYRWCVTTVDTLREMRRTMVEEGWWRADVNNVAKKVIDYFWYDDPHWVYTLHGGPTRTITVDGVNMSNFEYGSTNYVFWQQYVKEGVVYGVSYDFLPFVDSWLKSVGIASNDVWMVVAERPRYHWFNDFNTYYDPFTSTWTAYSGQINVWSFGDSPAEFIVFRPPVHQNDYLSHVAKHRADDLEWRKKQGLPYDVNLMDVVYLDVGWVYYPILDTSYRHGVPYSTGRDAVLLGIQSSQMKRWLLSSDKNPDSWW